MYTRALGLNRVAARQRIIKTSFMSLLRRFARNDRREIGAFYFRSKGLDSDHKGGNG